jgi:hypothetical protein
MSFLTKNQILAAEDRPSTEVEVPEWGGTVRIMAPSSWELSEHQASQIKVRLGSDGKPQTTVDMTGADAKLAALCIVDGEGKRLFDEKDVRKLGGKSAAALDRVVKAAKTLPGMSDAAQAVELVEGNSERTPEDTGNSA